ncbi:caspase family protein [Rhodopseudomonas sp. RCAM05734]|uniref:caspase family protein n=1 Tax=Rhodopseudomonas sp. RCAM05734 TaxID=3457549 RepID=UPI0040441961
MNRSAAFAVAALMWFSTGQVWATGGISIASPGGGSVHGLVIGIDAYQQVRPLKGAVADARDVEASLKGMGVTDVTVLVDAQASRAAVLREMNALLQRTKSNDVIFLSIAGHGAQEPERIKGSEPDGMENVFLLPDFAPTAAGSVQRILASEFNHFIKQFEMRGAKVVFVADTCHGGGMAREIDPRAEEMSFRQVPRYTLLVDKLQPVSDKSDPRSEFDFDRTAFLAAVDRSTKAPEVRIPGISGLRGALSYAVARAIEGGADTNHDGRITVSELFANVRQVVYQLSDQRQNIVTVTSPGQSPDSDVVFDLTRGVVLMQAPNSPPPSTNAAPAPSLGPPAPPAGNGFTQERIAAPIRLAVLDGSTSALPDVKSRDVTIESVQPTDNPDLIWDPSSQDVIAWGDVVAFKVDPTDLASVVDRTAAIRDLKKFATRSPQIMRVSPDDRQHRSNQTIDIDISDVNNRAVLLFNVSGDGTIQMLYPIGSDASLNQSANLRLPLRVREPFGAEQVVAITSQQRMAELESLLLHLNRRRAPGQVIQAIARYAPPDARIGSIGFFSVP